MIHVWDPICWMKALWLRGLRTVLFALDPSRMTLIGLRREFCTTKKIQARMMPNNRPITKSHLEY